MLTIQIPSVELYDETISKFVMVKGATIELEHSLLSIAKWETKWHVPFLGPDKKTDEQSIDYIRCMTLNRNVDPAIYYAITSEISEQVAAYLEDPMTASVVKDTPGGTRKQELITSELIYYWMIALTIPFEAQKWPLKRLLMLIRICNAKNAPPRKMSAAERNAERRAQNMARRSQYNTSG